MSFFTNLIKYTILTSVFVKQPSSVLTAKYEPLLLVPILFPQHIPVSFGQTFFLLLERAYPASFSLVFVGSEYLVFASLVPFLYRLWSYQVIGVKHHFLVSAVLYHATLEHHIFPQRPIRGNPGLFPELFHEFYF